MTSPSTRILVGLGNPGPEYAGTRHNVGFDVVDRVASAFGRSFHLKGRSELARGEVDAGPYLLCKPQTFMNRSGRAVRDLLVDDPAAELIVLCDDFNLPLGKMRCRRKGSAGGQNGLADIIERVEVDVPRLRLGIGSPGRKPAPDFVLERFKRAEEADVEQMVERAADALGAWLERRIDLSALIERVNSAS